jgi:integrase
MLTDAKCKNAKSPVKPSKLPDGKGLYLEVKPNGVKAWRYRFELAVGEERKESVFTIGEYGTAPAGETLEQAQERRATGVFTLAEARVERDKARGLVKQGVNPSHARELERIQKAQSAAITLEAVAREWVQLRPWEAVTKARRLRLFERTVFPELGKLPIAKVTPAHVLALLKKAAEENGLTVAAEIKRSLSGVYELAISTLRAESDPTYPVRNALPKNKTQHKRPLEPQEIGQLLRDIDANETGLYTCNALRLIWWTLARANEVCGMRWDELDLDAGVWVVPADRMKKRKEHRVPLPLQAVAVLRTLQPISGHRPYVFTHRDERDTHMSDAAMRQFLKSIGWAGQFSPHAARTTGATLLNGMCYSADHIERQLAHVEQNKVRAAYNHADHLPERRKMMQAWADYLDSLKAGAKVTPIFKTA